MRVAVVGATGLVGSTMLRILAERAFPVTELIPVASAASRGKTVAFGGRDWTTVTVEEAVALKPTLALFSAGGSVSEQWAPRFAEAGCTVIDNSSAWRMDPSKKLVVPEVNAHVLSLDDTIIANPNCSTIQMVLVLQPVYKRYGIRRVVVSTYQSVSGTGQKAVDALMQQRAGQPGEGVYPHPIDLNLIPQIDVFLDNGYSKEEMKMIRETRKIMGDESLRITATTVRVPVTGGHSESLNVELERDYDEQELRALLAASPGVVVQDEPARSHYPMPIHAAGRDEVFVGRIRRDESQPNSFNCWVVSDNLRKGAATNAVQIAERLLALGLR